MSGEALREVDRAKLAALVSDAAGLEEVAVPMSLAQSVLDELRRAQELRVVESWVVAGLAIHRPRQTALNTTALCVACSTALTPVPYPCETAKALGVGSS